MYSIVLSTMHTTRRTNGRVATLRFLRYACLLLLTLSSANASTTVDTVQCSVDLLKDLGWQISNRSDAPDIRNSDTCQHDLNPYFNIGNQNTNTSDTGASDARLLARIKKAIRSDTSRCLVNRRLRNSVAEATRRIIGNEDFVFPEPGEDPRDPFTPPAANWSASTRRGYDIPSNSLSDGIDALYREPVVAECAAAIQVAQLATLVEHYDNHVDRIVSPQEIGIGVWREFAKSPSIKANKPLLVSRKQRKRALGRLATLGRGAFYNQSGYMAPVNDSVEFIDSLDNRGQNFLIVDITEEAVADLKKRKRPLKELNYITLKIWHNYNRLRATGLQMDTLVELLENELLTTDSFFSDVSVYIHPLRTGTFAKFLARQFKYNPRTAYRFEIYEDFQTGYFFNKYVDHRLSQCESG